MHNAERKINMSLWSRWVAETLASAPVQMIARYIGNLKFNLLVYFCRFPVLFDRTVFIYSILGRNTSYVHGTKMTVNFHYMDLK